MDETTIMEQSTTRLKQLLMHASPEDFKLLSEYNPIDMSGNLIPKEMAGYLADEIRRNGSNDISSFITGHPVHYLEIVRNLANKMGIKWQNQETEDVLEQKICLKIFAKAWQKMSAEEKSPISQLFEQQGISVKYLDELLVEGTVIDLLPTIGYLVGWNIARLVAMVAARQVGVLGGELLLAEGIGSILLGPLGLAIGTVILAIEVAGPAYRKIIPSILQIAYMRAKYKAELQT